MLQLLSVTLCSKKVLGLGSLLQHYIVDQRYIDTENDDAQDILNAGEPEKILEISEFSMLRLHDIAEQRNIYSSVDDIVYAHDSDSDFDEPYDSSKFNLCQATTGRVLGMGNGNGNVPPVPGGESIILDTLIPEKVINDP